MLKSVRSGLILRGVLALIIGIVALAWPGITVGVFVILFSVYAFLAAVTYLGLAFRADRAGPVIGNLLIAVVSIAAGVLALAWPGLTAVALTLSVAAWALVIGATEVAMAFRRGEAAGERAMWALSGLVAVALAVALVLRPDLGALSLATLFGLFSVISGVTLLLTAAQLRSVGSVAERLASAV